jgi:hypothetical protein
MCAIRGRVAREQSDPLRFEIARVLVFGGGEEQEVGISRFKSPLRFHNAALSEHENLRGVIECGNHGRPFLERDVHARGISIAIMFACLSFTRATRRNT